jgi:hypothetical protein
MNETRFMPVRELVELKMRLKIRERWQSVEFQPGSKSVPSLSQGPHLSSPLFHVITEFRNLTTNSVR